MDYSQMFNTMITFVVIMSIGYIGARMGLFTVTFAKISSKLVMNVFLTASILNSVSGDAPSLSGAQLVHVMLIFTLVIFLCYALGALLIFLFGRRSPHAPIEELLMSVPNTMFVGFPIAQELFGSTAVLYFALSCIPFNFFLYSYGIWRLKSGTGSQKNSLRWRDMLTVPTLVTLLSLVIFLLKIPFPPVLQKLCTTLAASTMPMSMIVIGATLGSVSLLDAFKGLRSYLVCLVRLILAPLLVWFVLRFLTEDPMLLASGVIIAACPSAVMVTVLALQYDYDPIFPSEGVLASTALSMITLPLLIQILL